MAGFRLRANNLSGTIAENPLTFNAVSMTCPASAPVVVAPFRLVVTLEPDTANEEVVDVTNHVAGATTWTIVRGQEGRGGVGVAHAQGTAWKHGPTAGDFFGGADFNVMSPRYGAVGDAKESAVDDGAITTGTPNFTSASAAFVNATMANGGEIGKRHVLEGAGPGGLSLVANVIAVPSATSLTLSVNASTTVSGKHYAWGTPDGQAFINAAADAAASGVMTGGIPYVPGRAFMLELQVPTTVSWFFAGATIIAGLNTPRIFSVTGPDVRFDGRMTYVGMNLASDCFGGVSQSNTSFMLHAAARRCALPLATPSVPTLVAQAGTTDLTVGNYGGLVTYVDASGIETGGVGSTLTAVTAGQQLLYTASAVPANVTQVKFYLSSSTGAGVTLGLLATVVPVAGTATYTQVSKTAGVGGTAVIPGGNATGNLLVNLILNAGCKVDGFYTSLDSALIRLEGGKDLEMKGIKAGPYTRDPQQWIGFIGDIFGQRPQITNVGMYDSHVDGGGVITRSALVVAQAFGGGTHGRGAKMRGLSATNTASLADGVDIIQWDQVAWDKFNFDACQNGLNISGCTGVQGGTGEATNCRAPGIQVGDITVAFPTNLITTDKWTSIDCGVGGQTDFTASGACIFAPAGSSTNVVIFSDLVCYKSGNVLMKYGLGIGNGVGGTFSVIKVNGGFLLGQTAPYLDSSTTPPAIQWNNVGNVTDTFSELPQLAAAPLAPFSGWLRGYVSKVAGRNIPAWIGSDGASYISQAALHGPKIILWQDQPGGTNGSIIGSLAAVGAGTYAALLPTTTNNYTIVKRGTWKTVVTTANQNVGIRMAELCIFRSSTAGQGGWFFECRFGIEAWTAGDRFFIGLTASSTPVTGQPSALLNIAGLGIDAADTAFTFMHNDGTGTATKDAIAGQPALAANQGYAFYMFNPPGTAFLFYRLDNLNTGLNIIEGVTATDLPAVATMMQAVAMAGNAANAGAAAAGIGVGRIYVETLN